MLTDRLESEMPKLLSTRTVFVKGKSNRGTRGLFELLTRKKVDQSFITRRDLQSYRQILEATHWHLENNDPAGVIKRHVALNLKT